MKSLLIYIVLLFPIFAIAQQMPDSAFMAKHPLTVSYCGVFKLMGNITPSQIDSTDNIVLMYNYGNKWQIDSIRINWNDYHLWCHGNYISKYARHACGHHEFIPPNERYFWLEVNVTNKETGETKMIHNQFSIPREK